MRHRPRPHRCGTGRLGPGCVIRRPARCSLTDGAETWRAHHSARDRPTTGGGQTVTYETTKRLGTTVFLVFLAISFWGNPSGSAQVFTDFLGDVGGFFSTIIDKTAEFVGSLGS